MEGKAGHVHLEKEKKAMVMHCDNIVMIYQAGMLKKELFLCFQKLVSGELQTLYFGRFPTPGIEPGTLLRALMPFQSVTVSQEVSLEGS